MSSQVSSFDFAPMFRSIKEGLHNYLPESSERAWEILESTAILQITYSTLKNVPYAFLAKQFEINDLCHMLSSRVTYIESTLMVLVSLVHNLFFALFYTLTVVLTLGFSQNLNFSCKMHWSHMTYSFVAFSIGLVGIFTPYYGAGLNLMFLLSTVNSLKQSYRQDVNLFERPFVNEVQRIFEKNSALLHNYIRTEVGVHSYNEAYYKYSLEHIERRIYSAKRMDDLIDLAIDVYHQWPKVGVLDSSENIVP